jgi:hypothetical protein
MRRKARTEYEVVLLLPIELSSRPLVKEIRHAVVAAFSVEDQWLASNLSALELKDVT